MSAINLKQPNKLKKGDAIAIVSTARSLSIKDIERPVQWCQEQGYEVIIGKTIGSEDGIFAGNIDFRVKELQRFLDDEKTKVIWFARGGYGSIQVFPHINWSEFRKNPKWLVGFSDNTQWLMHGLQAGQSKSIHGAMPKTLQSSSPHNKSFFHLLSIWQTGEHPTYQWQSNKWEQQQIVSGRLVGGNLCTLQSSAPSISKELFNNGILFFEEIDEYIYEIDRSLRSMLNAGLFQGLKGVLVGQLSGVKDNPKAYGLSIEDVILNVFKNQGIPVFWDLPAGHEQPNWPLIIGAQYKLQQQGKNVSLNLKTS